MDALLSLEGVLEAFVVIEEAQIYVLTNDKAKLAEASLKKMIEGEFGYGLVSYKEEQNGDWKALKAKKNIK